MHLLFSSFQFPIFYFVIPDRTGGGEWGGVCVSSLGYDGRQLLQLQIVRGILTFLLITLRMLYFIQPVQV